MFNYEWKAEFKKKYLNVQHALSQRWEDESTRENNKKQVMKLKELCERYLNDNKDVSNDVFDDLMCDIYTLREAYDMTDDEIIEELMKYDYREDDIREAIINEKV